jgi:filamentous hemagglutinin
MKFSVKYMSAPDEFNRQLHPEEKTLAQELAANSGGKYTTAQGEDQMRIMGATVSGVAESDGVATLIGQAPSDAGASWLSAGQTTGGQPILTQTNAAVDPELQAYIINNYASVMPGSVPSVVAGYVASTTQPNVGAQTLSTGSSAGTICPNGNCGSYGTIPTQQQMSDAAGTASAQLGVISATAAAVAARTAAEPYVAEPAAAFSVATATGSFVMGGVQQVLSPNIGQYFTEGGVIGVVTYVAGDKYPLVGPLITQVGNMLPNGTWSSSFEKKVNEIFNGSSNTK